MANEKYNESKHLRKGEELMLFYEGKPIAFTTTHTIDMNGEEVSIANKMSSDWDASLSGKIGWTISVDAFTSVDPTHNSYDKLFEVMKLRKPIKIEIAEAKQTFEASTGDKTYAKGDVKYEGFAIITSLSNKSSAGEYETFSATLKGTGELVSKAAPKAGVGG